jgi:NAD-dependent deacetylase
MEESIYQKNINRICEHLQHCKRILFITGAGISAESGLPTYRGIGGLYNDKLTDLEMPIEVVLSGQMLEMKPEITWKYISQIEKACRGAKFNSAHKTIADVQKQFPDTWVLTQNIDGFHGDAGSKNIIDIHGDIHYLICKKCGFNKKVKDFSNLDIPPRCPQCSGIIRPDVVFFGEMLPENKVRILNRELTKGFDAVFSIGTTSVFPYIIQPIIQANADGILTIEINPAPTEISSIVTIKLECGARDALSDIWKEFTANYN